MKRLIENFRTSYTSNSNPQITWKLLKYEICKYTIKYTTLLG